MAPWNSASSIRGGELNEINGDIRADVQKQPCPLHRSLGINELQSLIGIVCVKVAGISDAVMISQPELIRSLQEEAAAADGGE